MERNTWRLRVNKTKKVDNVYAENICACTQRNPGKYQDCLSLPPLMRLITVHLVASSLLRFPSFISPFQVPFFCVSHPCSGWWTASPHPTVSKQLNVSRTNGFVMVYTALNTAVAVPKCGSFTLSTKCGEISRRCSRNIKLTRQTNHPSSPVSGCCRAIKCQNDMISQGTQSPKRQP